MMRSFQVLFLVLACITVAECGGEAALPKHRVLVSSMLQLFLVYFFVFWFWKLGLKFPSESSIAMLVGIAFCGLANVTGLYFPGEGLDFSEPFFATLILPMVMLNLGYNSRLRMLRLNMLPVFIWAISSVVINVSLFAAAFYGIQKWYPGADWPQYGDDTRLLIVSLFAATIVSAVEPDAMLAFMFEKYELENQVPQPVLFALLLWESIISCTTMFDSAEVLLYMGLYDEALSPGMQGCIGRGTPSPTSWAPSLCPATVSLTASASFDGICNRQ